MADQGLMDYYEILQVSPRADRDTIERVFRYLANRFHPDNRETGDVDRFKEIVEAYEVLSSAAKRAHYDLNYENLRERRWRLFNQETAADTVVVDGRIRQSILSILYIVRRNQPYEPGVAPMELERLLECPEPVVRFHLWYLRENNWLTRIESGHFAITALGVDRLFELGGPAQAPYVLHTNGRTTPRTQRALLA